MRDIQTKLARTGLRRTGEFWWHVSRVSHASRGQFFEGHPKRGLATCITLHPGVSASLVRRARLKPANALVLRSNQEAIVPLPRLSCLCLFCSRWKGARRTHCTAPICASRPPLQDAKVQPESKAGLSFGRGVWFSELVASSTLAPMWNDVWHGALLAVYCDRLSLVSCRQTNPRGKESALLAALAANTCRDREKGRSHWLSSASQFLVRKLLSSPEGRRQQAEEEAKEVLAFARTLLMVPTCQNTRHPARERTPSGRKMLPRLRSADSHD